MAVKQPLERLDVPFPRSIWTTTSVGIAFWTRPSSRWSTRSFWPRSPRSSR